MKLELRTVERLVVVRPGRIGDYLCATPALRALRRLCPDAELTLVGLPTVADVVARSRLVDRLAIFPGAPGIAEQWFDARRTVEFLREQQAQRYDLAVQLYGSGVYSNPFTLYLGARTTVGFVRTGDPPGLLELAVPLPDEGHEIDRCLALPAAIDAGAASSDRTVEFMTTAEDRAAAEEIVSALSRPVVVLHASASDAPREWTPVAARHLGRRVDERGGSVLVVGGPGEAALASEMAEAAGPCARSIAGQTSLPVLGALLAQSDLVCTTDSGPAHIAYAVGARSLTWFRVTSPERWGPPSGGPHRAVVGGERDAVAAIDECVASLGVRGVA